MLFCRCLTQNFSQYSGFLELINRANRGIPVFTHRCAHTHGDLIGGGLGLSRIVYMVGLSETQKLIYSFCSGVFVSSVNTVPFGNTDEN